MAQPRHREFCAQIGKHPRPPLTALVNTPPESITYTPISSCLHLRYQSKTSLTVPAPPSTPAARAIFPRDFHWLVQCPGVIRRSIPGFPRVSRPCGGGGGGIVPVFGVAASPRAREVRHTHPGHQRLRRRSECCVGGRARESALLCFCWRLQQSVEFRAGKRDPEMLSSCSCFACP